MSPDTHVRTASPSVEPRRVSSTFGHAVTPPATQRLEPALFGLVLVAADVLTLTLGIPFAWALRFTTGAFPTPLGVPALGAYVWTLPVVLPLGLFVFQQLGLYRPHRATGLLRDLTHGVKAVAFLTMLLAAVAFFYRDFSFSRSFLLLYASVAIVQFAAWRRLAAMAHAWMRARDIGVERVAMAGRSDVADRLAAKIAARPGTGLRVVARLEGDDWELSDTDERALRPLRVRSFLRKERVDRLIVTDPKLTAEDRLDLVEACHEAGARCDFVPDLFELVVGRVRLEEIDGVPLVGTRLVPLGRLDRIQKRTLDVVCSALALVVFAPLLGLLAALVKLGSPGPALYRQLRIGRDGREFDIVKYRSMPVAAESGSGPVRASRADARPTAVGRILRRTSLDELPQLWNVLKGEMSLVGPRPERPYFVESFQRAIPRYLERHGVKSGITGWAQVHGLRGDTSIEERTRYDIWYVENWSLSLDVKILLLTSLRFLFQEEAY